MVRHLRISTQYVQCSSIFKYDLKRPCDLTHFGISFIDQSLQVFPKLPIAWWILTLSIYLSTYLPTQSILPRCARRALLRSSSIAEGMDIQAPSPLAHTSPWLCSWKICQGDRYNPSAGRRYIIHLPTTGYRGLHNLVSISQQASTDFESQRMMFERNRGHIVVYTYTVIDDYKLTLSINQSSNQSIHIIFAWIY